MAKIILFFLSDVMITFLTEFTGLFYLVDRGTGWDVGFYDENHQKKRSCGMDTFVYLFTSKVTHNFKHSDDDIQSCISDYRASLTFPTSFW